MDGYANTNTKIHGLLPAFIKTGYDHICVCVGKCIHVNMSCPAWLHASIWPLHASTMMVLVIIMMIMTIMIVMLKAETDTYGDASFGYGHE